MNLTNSHPILSRLWHLVLLAIICIMATSILLILTLVMSQQKIHSNLKTFSQQLINHPLPPNTSMINSFSVVGATAGMGNNRFYYSVLLVESLERQKNLEQYYRSAKFKPTQSKSPFDEDMPPMKMYVLPISEWEVMRESLCNISDDSVFNPWYLNEDNPNCYLVVLKDGAYYSFVSIEPYYQQPNSVE